MYDAAARVSAVVPSFGGVRGSAGVTDRLTSPNSDPFDTEMYLILESEKEVRCRMCPLSLPHEEEENPRVVYGAALATP